MKKLSTIKRVGFNIDLTVSMELNEHGHSVWLDYTNQYEIDEYLKLYLQEVVLFSKPIGDFIEDHGATTTVNEVRFWKDE